MKRSIAVLLSTSLIALALPRQAAASGHTSNEASLAHEHAPQCADTSLVFSGKQRLENGWIQTYNIYADDITGDVWGDGYAEDPDSYDAGAPGRWLSYSHYNGEFAFLGSDDGEPFEGFLGPADLKWSWDPNSGWIPEFNGNPGPQPIWHVVLVVAAAAILLSGDGGCSCGHSGGTENHPGTNNPEPKE